MATVCFVLIAISILAEYLLHLFAKHFSKKRRVSLIGALDKVKSEFMRLGFVSLFLNVLEKSIANICIPRSTADTFLPCGGLSIEAEEESKCKQGKVSLLSRKGLQELQLFIFALAFFYALSCAFTFALGRAKMWRWEHWQAETRTLEYQISNDPRRLKLTRQTTFAKRHLSSWTNHQLLRWPVSFLRQFYDSVSKVDYLTLRHGFLVAHFAEGSDYDFQKYVQRTLEEDFQVVVGISLWVWVFFVLFIFFHAHVFHSFMWLPFIPLVMLLVVGTKLQDIITRMCMDTHGKAIVVRGTLLVKPSDHFFWFNSPKLLLHIMHLILLQNSFQVAFFIWTWVKFGFRSCFHKRTDDIVIRLVLGLLVQVLCGYATMPSYALVTKMGSSMRKSVFKESVIVGLQRWRRRAHGKMAQSRNEPLSSASL